MRSREDRLLFGHLWAAGAASSLLFILLFGKGVVSELMHLSFSPRLFLGVLTLLPVFFIFWLMVAACTWFTGTIPLVIAFLIAEKSGFKMFGITF
jgi:hypothetical protein